MLHQIGVGVLGPVFRTYEPERDRLVAVKVFRLDITPEQARALADELNRIVSLKVAHPALIPLVAAGVEGTVAYLAQEYVAAESLDVALRHYAPAALDRVLPYVAQLAGAIDTAALAGVHHGALHPRDIVVTPDDARATGFGVVGALERVGLRGPVRRPYSAPERIAGSPWGTPADVFALAAVTFELLTGRRAAGTGDQAAAMLGDVKGDVDGDALARVLATALNEDPRRRHQTARDFATAVDAVTRGKVAREPGASHRLAVAPAAASRPGRRHRVEQPAPADREAARPDEQPVDPALETSQGPAVESAIERSDVSHRADEFDWQPDERDAADRSASATGDAWQLDTVVHGDEPRGGEKGERDWSLELATLSDREPPGARVAPTPQSLFDDEEVTRRESGGDRVQSEGEVDAEPAEPVAETAAWDDDGGATVGAYGHEEAAPSASEPVAQPQPPVAALSGLGSSFAPPAERIKTPMLPVAVGVMVGILVGFIAGYGLASRDRPRAASSQPMEAAASQPVPAAQPAPPQPAQSWTEGAVADAAGEAKAERRQAEPSAAPTAAAAPAPAPATPAAPPGAAEFSAASARLLIRSMPGGAQVTVNGERRGATPLTVQDLAYGTHTVRVTRPGYEPDTRRVTLSRRQPSASVTFTLDPVRAAEPARPAGAGGLVVESRPAGARVVLDGKPVGTTPLVLADVGAGPHQVRLEREGYRPWVTTTRVVAGERTRVAASLEPGGRR